jgi:hypothetical protein
VDLANDQFELGDHRIWVPKLGWVNMAENLRFKGKVTGARITKTYENQAFLKTTLKKLRGIGSDEDGNLTADAG